MFTGFISSPSTSNQIGLNDYFTGDGTTSTFTLVNNAVSSLANRVESNNAFYLQSNGGVTGSGTSMTLSSPPPASAGIIAPNQAFGILEAYDHSPYAQVTSAIFAVGDVVDIQNQYYTSPPGGSGIKVYYSNHIASGGAQFSWLQFAPLNAIDMSVGTYQTAGTPFFVTDPIEGFNQIATGGASSAGFTINVNDASSFVAGQWILIDDSTNTEELWIASISSNTLTTLQPLAYNHAAGKNVYACAAGMSVKLTVPNNAGGGIPVSLFNLSLDMDYKTAAR